MAPGSSPQQVVEREISGVPIRGADDRVADGPADRLACVADDLRSVLPPRGGHKLDQSRIHEAAPR